MTAFEDAARAEARRQYAAAFGLHSDPAVARLVTNVADAVADLARDHLTAQQGAANPLHHLDLVIEDGTVQTRFRCAAAPDASCRRRPPDADDRESWTDAEATETGHPCWAVEWASIGLEDALTGEDCTLGSVPVSIGYDECVIVEPVLPHPVIEGLTEREPTDAEVEAGARAWAENGPSLAYYDRMSPEMQERTKARMRLALRAAAPIRKEQER